MERTTQPAVDHVTGRTASEVALPFEAFFQAERTRLFRALVVITGSMAEAEDIAQEAFLRAWERWDRVATLEQPAGYLHRTAMNAFRDRYRRSKLSMGRAVHSIPEPHDDLGAVEARSVTSQILAGLSPRQRAAIVLTEGLGYSAEEAGVFLGISGSTVRSLRHQARANLATNIGVDHE